MNSRSIVPCFTPFTATGQCSSTCSSSGVTSNVIAETDESETDILCTPLRLNLIKKALLMLATCPCCSASSDSSSVPFQPLQKQFSQKRQGKQTQAFQCKWFQEHTWLYYCATCEKAFCHVCCVAINKALMRMPKKGVIMFSLLMGL